MREIKLTNSFKATQRNEAVRKREMREKVDEEFQGNATQRRSARERNQRKKS